MKNAHWLILGVAHISLNAILGTNYSPNLDTGLAVDSFKYMAAMAWYVLSPILFYGYILRESAKDIKVSSYGLNAGSVVLIISLVIITFLFWLYNGRLADNFDDYWIANAVLCFIVILLLAGLSRINVLSEDITNNHNLNTIKKNNLKIDIEQLRDYLIIKTNRNPKIVKIFEKLLEEIRFLPNQVPMHQYAAYNKTIQTLLVDGKELFQDYAIGTSDADSKIERLSMAIEHVIGSMSGFKNFK
jgi:hypothetical protein